MVFFQEKIELSQEQQAILSFIVEAYQKHRIPQDMAKKLVFDISYNSSKCVFQQAIVYALQLRLIRRSWKTP